MSARRKNEMRKAGVVVEVVEYFCKVRRVDEVVMNEKNGVVLGDSI